MTELHVIADERTTWRVYETGTAVALTEHTNATDAELAARALADNHGAKRVVVHYRYHRTHDAAAQGAMGTRGPRPRPPARRRPRTRWTARARTHALNRARSGADSAVAKLRRAMTRTTLSGRRAAPGGTATIRPKP
jgi:hypothetical protein